MRLVLRTLAAVLCAAALGLASPALAVGGYTITAGTQTSGQTAFTGTSGDVTFGTSAGLLIICDRAATLGGSVELGPDQSGASALTVGSTSFRNCVGPLGIPLDITQTRPWHVDLVGPPGQVTSGRITNVGFHVSNPDGQCDFDVTGSLDANVNTGSEQLNITAGNVLTLSDVENCFGIFNDGDTMDLIATYDLDVQAGPLAVTSSS